MDISKSIPEGIFVPTADAMHPVFYDCLSHKAVGEVYMYFCLMFLVKQYRHSSILSLLSGILHLEMVILI